MKYFSKKILKINYELVNESAVKICYAEKNKNKRPLVVMWSFRCVQS